MRIAILFIRSAVAAVLVWAASVAIIVGGNSGCPSFFEFVELSGGNVVPPNVSQGSGTGRYELNADETELRFVITASGLSGPVTEVHFHNLSLDAETRPVVFDLAPFLTEVDGQVSVSGASSLADWSTDNALEEILQGRIYVDLHTDAYPDGEIRGGVFVSP